MKNRDLIDLKWVSAWSRYNYGMVRSPIDQERDIIENTTLAKRAVIERINNLHVLRIVAALFVVYYHTGYHLLGLQSFGGFSVPIFFVISGFVMAMIATEQPKDFLRRRLLRALPTYWVATLGIFAISLVLPTLFHSTRPHAMWLFKSLFFIPFEKAPGIIQPLVFVGWTMNCEIVLYLLIAAGLRFTRRPVLFAGVTMLLFMSVCALFADLSAAAFFYSRSTMLSFVLGLAAYPLWKRLTKETANCLRWYAYGMGAGVLVALCLLEGRMMDPYLSADGMFTLRPVLPQVGALLIVLCALVLAKSGHDVRSDKVIIVAESTYVLYLMHAYLLMGMAKVTVRLSPTLAMNRSLGLIVAIGCSVGLAVIMHVYIEKPGLAFLKDRLATQRKSGLIPEPSRGWAIEPVMGVVSSEN